MGRVIICTIGGVITGRLCMTGGYLTGNTTEITFSSVFPFFYNRMILGFLIGVRNLMLDYLLNVTFMGLLVFLICSLLVLEENTIGFILFSSTGIIYGTLIDWFTAKILKTHPNYKITTILNY